MVQSRHTAESGEHEQVWDLHANADGRTPLLLLTGYRNFRIWLDSSLLVRAQHESWALEPSRCCRDRPLCLAVI